jgi:hypothetical protein
MESRILVETTHSAGVLPLLLLLCPEESSLSYSHGLAQFCNELPLPSVYLLGSNDTQTETRESRLQMAQGSLARLVVEYSVIFLFSYVFLSQPDNCNPPSSNGKDDLGSELTLVGGTCSHKSPTESQFYLPLQRIIRMMASSDPANNTK